MSLAFFLLEESCSLRDGSFQICQHFQRVEDLEHSLLTLLENGWKTDVVYVIVIQATGSSCSAASTVSATWTSRGLRCHTWRRRHWSPSFPATGNHGNHGKHGNLEIFPRLSAPLVGLKATECYSLKTRNSGDHLTECDWWATRRKSPRLPDSKPSIAI